MSRIRFLERKEIDVDRWDRCVLHSPHTDIYARSQWLDIMAKQWSGLVQDDYQAVLPIPWNRKFFLSYIYTPRFTSPLPLCGSAGATLPLADFLAQIPARFIRWDLDISLPDHETTAASPNSLPGPAATIALPANPTETIALTDTPIRWPHRFRNNHLLSLDKPYPELFSAFRPGYRNLVRQASRAGLQVVQASDHRETILRAADHKKIPGMKKEDYRRFLALCDRLAVEGMVESWECRQPGGQPCAGMVLLRDHRKLYYLLSWSDDYGRSHAAAHLLMARIIEAHADSRLVLDFEGSDHAGIRHFMEGFGPRPISYIAIRKR